MKKEKINLKIRFVKDKNSDGYTAYLKKHAIITEGDSKQQAMLFLLDALYDVIKYKGIELLH
jgi:hypothetical protein